MTDLLIELLPNKKTFKILEQSERMYKPVVSSIGKMAVCSSCYPAVNSCTICLRGSWKERDNEEVRCGYFYPDVLSTFYNLKKEGYDIKFEMRMKL